MAEAVVAVAVCPIGTILFRFLLRLLRQLRLPKDGLPMDLKEQQVLPTEDLQELREECQLLTIHRQEGPMALLMVAAAATTATTIMVLQVLPPQILLREAIQTIGDPVPVPMGIRTHLDLVEVLHHQCLYLLPRLLLIVHLRLLRALLPFLRLLPIRIMQMVGRHHHHRFRLLRLLLLPGGATAILGLLLLLPTITTLTTTIITVQAIEGHRQE